MSENNEKNIIEENVTEENIEEKPKKKPRKKKLTKAQLRKILKESECTIVNNTNSRVTYRGNDFSFELSGYTDEDIVEIESLRKMHVKCKSFFSKYWILITDIYCDDERITLQDVYEYIGIEKYYFGDFKNPNCEFFDKVLLNDSIEKFQQLLNAMNKELITQLFSRACMLYEQGKFDSARKIQIIEEKIGREDCFRDIKKID